MVRVNYRPIHGSSKGTFDKVAQRVDDLIEGCKEFYIGMTSDYKQRCNEYVEFDTFNVIYENSRSRTIVNFEKDLICTFYDCKGCLNIANGGGKLGKSHRYFIYIAIIRPKRKMPKKCNKSRPRTKHVY